MSNSMPWALSTAWVKNVYSLRMDSGIARGETSFSYTPPTPAFSRLWVQSPIFTHIPLRLSAVLPTLKNTYFHLLIHHLYPVSTAPIIKKKKENKERNS